MNVNQIVNMVIRMVMRRVLRTGVNAGIDAVGRRFNKGKPTGKQDSSPSTAETTKRARQAMRATRKFGRF